MTQHALPSAQKRPRHFLEYIHNRLGLTEPGGGGVAVEAFELGQLDGVLHELGAVGVDLQPALGSQEGKRGEAGSKTGAGGRG